MGRKTRVPLTGTCILEIYVELANRRLLARSGCRANRSAAFAILFFPRRTRAVISNGSPTVHPQQRFQFSPVCVRYLILTLDIRYLTRISVYIFICPSRPLRETSTVLTVIPDQPWAN